MTSNIGAIYLLADPDTREVRYVGQAINPRKRYNLHIAQAKRGLYYPVCDWIRSILKVDKKPIMSVEIVIPKNRLDLFEKSYIGVLRSYGFRLLNVTDGGSVPMLGRKFTEEHCKKIGDANRGKKRTEEQRITISLAHKDIKQTDMQRQAQSERQKGKKHRTHRKYGPMTEEHKKHISEAKRGQKMSPEVVARMSEIRIGVPHPHIGHHVSRKRKVAA